MNMGRAVAPWVPWVLGPIRWQVKVGIVVMALLTFWFARVPGHEVRVNGKALLVWAGVGVVWVLWPLLRWVVARRNGWRRIVAVGRPSDLAVGVLIAFVLVAVWLKWPMRAAVRLSQPSMDALVAEVQRVGKTPGTDRHVGLYTASDIRRVPGGLKFTVNEIEPLGIRTGFVYLPKADPKRASWQSYRYVGNGWWSWREDG